MEQESGSTGTLERNEAYRVLGLWFGALPLRSNAPGPLKVTVPFVHRTGASVRSDGRARRAPAPD